MNPHKHNLVPFEDKPGLYFCDYPGGCWIEFWTSEAVDAKLQEMSEAAANQHQSDIIKT